METIASFTDLANAESAENCQVLAQDGGTMRLRVPHFVDIGNPVKIEASDAMALGEVSCCQRDGDSYVVWVEVLEQLQNLAELTRLARALVGDAVTAEVRRS